MSIHTTYRNYAEPYAVRDGAGVILCECDSIQEAEDVAMRMVRQHDLDHGAPSVRSAPPCDTAAR